MRILYRVVHALYRGRRWSRIDDTDRIVRLLVLVRRDIATATLDSHLNLELAVLVDRRNVEVRVKDLDTAWWWVMVPPLAMIASQALVLADFHCSATSPRCPATMVKYSDAPVAGRRGRYGT